MMEGTLEVTHQARPVLLLYVLPRELDNFTRRLNDCAPHCKIFPIHLKPDDCDLLPAFEECCKLIETFNISVIVNGHEIGSLLHSALADRYSLCGPSFLSSFLTVSKRYTREVIAEPLQLNLPFAVVENDNKEELQELMSVLPSNKKMIVKPIYESSSRSLKVMATKDEVWSLDILSTLADLKASSRYLICRSAMAEFMTNQPYSIEQGYMIEMYVEKDQNVNTFHGVDGLVYKKSFIPWCIRDHIFWSHKPECHIGNAFPTNLTAEVQEQVWEVVASLASKMIQFGFDYQFFEAEVMVLKSGKIYLMEINGRMPFTMTSKAYAEALINGEPTSTFLSMADNKVIKQPVPQKDIHGLFGYITMLCNGKVSDVIDIEKVKEAESVVLIHEAGDIIDGKSSAAGSNIGTVDITGTSRATCMETLKKIITHITKIKESSPWFLEEHL